MSENQPTSEGNEPQTPAAPQAPTTPPAISSIDQIPQNLRNQLEANHKRGLQSELAAARQQLEQLNQLKDQTAHLYEMLGDKVQFEEGSDLDDVASKIGGTLESLKSEKEKMEAANKKQAELLTAAQKEAEQNRNLYHDTLVMNDLFSQLGGDRAVSPKAAELIAKELKQFAIVEEGKVGFKMSVTDENDHTAEQVVSAKDAVDLLESQSDWAAFFSATVNSGTGGENLDGLKRNKDGSVNLNDLTSDPVRYLELMKTNPEAVQQALKASG